MRSKEEIALLEQWLEAGHELGNHSYRHLSYTSVGADEYIEDIERARVALTELLELHDKQVRYYRFPMLREGDTAAKLAAMRNYLQDSGQQNLHVTIERIRRTSRVFGIA